jgi:myo-inositol-1(or 4)-monophosphatase
MPWNTDIIRSLLLEAGRIALGAKEDLRSEFKRDRSIVTRADKEIEALFTKALERPEAGAFLIGEETVEEKGEPYIARAMEEECFVLDPVDGTAPYAHRLPLWGVSIGRMVHGELVDGAVYLPDMQEMVLSDGPEVIEGTLRGSEWTWRRVGAPHPAFGEYGLISITQGMAKRGRVSLPNPVVTLGTAVVPLVGLLQGRFVAYVGSVKLWDLAGSLPLLLRKGFSVTVCPEGERREVTARVEERTYHLQPDSKYRWSLRSDLLVCYPKDEERLRAGFRSTEE